MNDWMNDKKNNFRQSTYLKFFLYGIILRSYNIVINFVFLCASVVLYKLLKLHRWSVVFFNTVDVSYWSMPSYVKLRLYKKLVSVTLGK